VKIFIQNETGSFVKHMHNEKTIEPAGSSKVSRPYPFPYGFILHISADGGLNVDCYVLTSQPLKTGQIVDCEPIALMGQTEDGQEDHNVLAVTPGEQRILDEETMVTLTEFVSHVFDHIPGKSIKAGKFLGVQTALAHISSHRDSPSTPKQQNRGAA
jgi:inorganic pyrophosphatase